MKKGQWPHRVAGVLVLAVLVGITQGVLAASKTLVHGTVAWLWL